MPLGPMKSGLRTQPYCQVVLLLAIEWLVGMGCGDGDRRPPTEPYVEAEKIEVTPQERARLQALGYADTAAGPANQQLSGVVVHDAGAVQTGYRLYSGASACEAKLIDVDGNLIRRWHGPTCMSWSHAQLLPNGDMLAVVVARPTPDKGGNSYLLRQSWSGEPVWKLEVRPHHDAMPLPDGSLLALVNHPIRDPEIFAGGIVNDNRIVRVVNDGKPSRVLSLVASLKAWQGPCQLRDTEESRPGEKDLLHTNSIKWIDGAEISKGESAYPRPLILLSMRHQDCVYLVDWDSGAIVWAWGREHLDGPHDATFLANGNLLVFDNGLVRGWSRVLEIELPSGDIVWRYPGEVGEPFFTAGRGSSQRLPNGNTLIAESGEGRALEVIPSGKTVWEFYNPRHFKGRREQIIRMVHYDASFIDSLLSADRAAQ